MLKILDIDRCMTSIFVNRSLFSPGHPGSDLFGVYNGAYNTRFDDEGRLIVPRVLTNHSRQAITNRGPQIYNDIQCHCKSSGSIDLLKLTLKNIYSDCMISDYFSLCRSCSQLNLIEMVKNVINCICCSRYLMHAFAI